MKVTCDEAVFSFRLVNHSREKRPVQENIRALLLKFDLGQFNKTFTSLGIVSEVENILFILQSWPLELGTLR